MKDPRVIISWILVVLYPLVIYDVANRMVQVYAEDMSKVLWSGLILVFYTYRMIDHMKYVGLIKEKKD